MVKIFGTKAEVGKLTLSKKPGLSYFSMYFRTGFYVLFLFLLINPHIVIANSGGFLSSFMIVDAGQDVSICKGDTTQLSASGASTYSWSPSTGLSCTDCPSPRAFPQSTTKYFVLAGDGTIDSVIVTVLDLPSFLPTNNVHPSDCSAKDGSITINGTGSSTLEYSIDGGRTWHPDKVFTGLGEGNYDISVRYLGALCQTDYPFGTVVLQSENSFFIQSISPAHPTGCHGKDGSITINASTSGLKYSIDDGAKYQSNGVFTGLSPGTYAIRVQREGSNCSVTAQVQLLILKGCKDTLDVIIPPGTNTRYCIDTAAFEIKGKVTAAAFCGTGSMATVSANNLDSSCLTLIPASGFKGTSTSLICVINCFDNNLGACDTTYLRITVSDGTCTGIFPNDTLSVPFAGNPTPVCIPLAPAKAAKYNISLNGNPIGNFVGCSFDSVYIYSYSFITGSGLSGPYMLESWSVNGILFTGSFLNVHDFVGLMNVFDPSGKWQLDTGTGILYGGNLKSTYGNMRVRHVPTSSSSVIQPNLSILPAGFTINLTSAELHTLTAIEPVTGCVDTLFVNLPVGKTTTERVSLVTGTNIPTKPYCISAAELPGKEVANTSICRPPSNGTLSFQSDTCVVYTPVSGFAGLDTFCVLICSNTTPQVCDTAIFTVRVQPKKDTVRLTINPGVGKLDTCLSSQIIGLSGNISRAEYCSINTIQLTGTIQSNCLTLQAAEGFYGQSEVCLIQCDASVCDTTILLVTVKKPDNCKPIFSIKEINASLQGDTSIVCLPLLFEKSSDYRIFLDGKLYNRSLQACDKDFVWRYNWAAVAGSGKQGPYDVNWNAYGGTFTAVVPNMTNLVTLLNNWDPAGLWVIDTVAFTFTSSNDNGIYGNLRIVQRSSGSTSNLIPVSTELAAGSVIVTKGPGTKQVVFVDKNTGCRDTVLVKAIKGAKVIHIRTVENVPSRAECLDTTALSGKFSGIGICKLPANGMIISNGNCFTYNPNGAFIGKDEACLTVCDDLGNCDTILLYITVDPLCRLFDFFPSTVQNFTLDTCSAFQAYCVPVRMDSLVRFAITDNGLPYTAGFNYCNGNQAQLKLDTGFHTIVFRHLTTGCFDTLKANVRCKVNPTNCGVRLFGSNQIKADDCRNKTDLCFELPFAEIGNYAITLNGQKFTGPFVACGQASNFTGIKAETGKHTFVFRDTISGCADTVTVNITCPDPINVVIERNLNIGDSMTLCLADFGYNINLIDSVVAFCPAPKLVNATFHLNKTTWCLTARGLLTGRDTVCYRVYGKGISGTFEWKLNVTPPCKDWFTKDTIRTISNNCVAGFGTFCIPLSPTEIKGKEVFINGNRFTGDFLPCKFDSLYILNYNELPGRGLVGPYSLDRWSINGILFNGEFRTAQELLALMLSWDPSGKWVIVPDPTGQTTLIRGGNPQNSYSAMQVTQKNTGIKTVLGINAVFMPISVSVPLPPGTHKVKIVDPPGFCQDSVIAMMGCITTSTFRDSLGGGKSKTYCLDLSDLPGQVTGIKEVCGAQQIGIVDVKIEGSCVTLTGIKVGQQTVCIVACDNLGFCDTTKLSINVTGNAQLIPDAVNDTIKAKQETVLTIPVLLNDKFQNLSSRTIQKTPSHGTAAFLPDGTVSYSPAKGYCDEKTPDSFTYTLCSSLGCDTATVFITVECKSLHVFNAFSPNGDGINDFFIINGLQNFPNHKLQIFNRWGNLIYEAVKYQNNWAGTWEGRDVPDGTYIYMLDLGDGSKPLKGTVYIRR